MMNATDEADVFIRQPNRSCQKHLTPKMSIRYPECEITMYALAKKYMKFDPKKQGLDFSINKITKVVKVWVDEKNEYNHCLHEYKNKTIRARNKVVGSAIAQSMNLPFEGIHYFRVEKLDVDVFELELIK